MTDQLADTLRETWRQQAEVGFLLEDPATAHVEIRRIPNHQSGVEYRLRWLPHREIRSDIDELKRRGIVNPELDGTPLFRDPRDAPGRFCFLCSSNIRKVNPLEALVWLTLAGRGYFAGANFAWIADHHYTVMAADHVDQDYSPHVLEAMLELHTRTNGEFRVIYNGAHAGATIPWHLHFQVTSEPMPVETLPEGGESHYPAALSRHRGPTALDEANAAIETWLEPDREHRRINILVAGALGDPTIHVFRRDRRLTHAKAKGLIGGFEMCGDLVFSEPDKREVFEQADGALIRQILEEVRPEGT